MSERRLPFSPWWLVAAVAAAMGMAGLYQFVWSSIRDPLGVRFAASEAALGTGFTLVIAAQTVSQFPAGWVRDRYGPRPPLAVGMVFVAAGFALVATVEGLALLYLGLVVGGAGAGATYSVAINTPVKWFDERRGLATGAVAMSYSGVSFVAIPLIRARVDTAFAPTLLALVGVAAVVAVVAVAVVRDPAVSVEEASPATDGGDTRRSGTDESGDGEGGAAETPESAVSWREAVRTWQFWVLYAAFVVVNGVGLMVIGKLVSYADSLELSAVAATVGASVVALADAAGVLVGGAVADRVGEETTIAAALVCCGVALAGGVGAGAAGVEVGFVALVGLAAFFRSPSFAIFPVLVGRYYGSARSSENYAALYTAKLWGGIGGGVVASLVIATVGWNFTFLGGAVLVALAGLSLRSLRPVER
jgi:OFA family oxalate/formate antiporter-like MFS transporter